MNRSPAFQQDGLIFMRRALASGHSATSKSEGTLSAIPWALSHETYLLGYFADGRGSSAAIDGRWACVQRRPEFVMCSARITIK
jgi:hypothetical protein